MKGAIATKASGQIAAGGNASDRASPAATQTSSRAASPGRAAFTRSRGRASSSCPPVGCGASRGSSCVQVNSVDWMGTTRDSPASSGSPRVARRRAWPPRPLPLRRPRPPAVSCFSSRSWMDSTSPRPGSGVTPPSAMSSAVGSRSSIGCVVVEFLRFVLVDVAIGSMSSALIRSSSSRALLPRSGAHPTPVPRSRLRIGPRTWKGPKRPLGPRCRGTAFSTQPLGSSVRHRRGGDAARTVAPPRGEGQGRAARKSDRTASASGDLASLRDGEDRAGARACRRRRAGRPRRRPDRRARPGAGTPSCPPGGRASRRRRCGRGRRGRARAAAWGRDGRSSPPPRPTGRAG